MPDLIGEKNKENLGACGRTGSRMASIRQGVPNEMAEWNPWTYNTGGHSGIDLSAARLCCAMHARPGKYLRLVLNVQRCGVSTARVALSLQDPPKTMTFLKRRWRSGIGNI
jgi:hypothetical protein